MFYYFYLFISLIKATFLFFLSQSIYSVSRVNAFFSISQIKKFAHWAVGYTASDNGNQKSVAKQ